MRHIIHIGDENARVLVFDQDNDAFGACADIAIDEVVDSFHDDLLFVAVVFASTGTDFIGIEVGIIIASDHRHVISRSAVEKVWIF